MAEIVTDIITADCLMQHTNALIRQSIDRKPAHHIMACDYCPHLWKDCRGSKYERLHAFADKTNVPLDSFRMRNDLPDIEDSPEEDNIVLHCK